MTESDEELDGSLEHKEAVDAVTHVARPVRAPQQYLKDASNLVGFYTDEDFRKRYRVLHMLLLCYMLL